MPSSWVTVREKDSEPTVALSLASSSRTDEPSPHAAAPARSSSVAARPVVRVLIHTSCLNGDIFAPTSNDCAAAVRRDSAPTSKMFTTAAVRSGSTATFDALTGRHPKTVHKQGESEGKAEPGYSEDTYAKRTYECGPTRRQTPCSDADA